MILLNNNERMITIYIEKIIIFLYIHKMGKMSKRNKTKVYCIKCQGLNIIVVVLS